jgi:hypothetical protein
MYAETLACSVSELLSHVGQHLMTMHVDLEHRQAWNYSPTTSPKEMDLIQSHVQKYQRPKRPIDLHIISQ